MTDPAADARDLPERPAYLAIVALPAAIWFAHFLVSYGTVSVWCARVAGDDGTLDALGPFAAGLTAAALAGIGWVGWGGYRRHRHGSETVPHDMDTPGDRHRFLGFATMLMAGLSAIATIFVSLSFLFVETCR